ncbi:hypothetical protein [Aquipuribacter hungaricus]|uniref:Uncharacterized protein n=1 Tax=Aquipuribacter hungaricus TaxID=545624 RepID=A0ABV7WBR8_9MICO
MGQPDDREPDELGRDGREPVEVRLLRTEDLIDLRLEAPGCTIEPTDGSAELVAGPDALLVVHFPPQHLGEETWPVGVPGPTLPPTRPSAHRAAEPSRLVYELPEGTRITWTLRDVLEALQRLQLRVAPAATPAGTAGEGSLEPPTDRETAIEAPYRLVVSPSARGVFRHSGDPVGPAGRSELWRTALGVRRSDGQERPDGEPEGPAAEGPRDEGAARGGADPDDGQRVVRALWNRDRDGRVDPPQPGFEMSLDAFSRGAVVDQTTGADPRNADTPLEVRHLALSSLGAWFDWKQSWESGSVVDYRHQAFMGRDGYVRVAYPGFLFPFGHRCFLVEVTEREIKHRETPVAYLWKRWFIVVRQPTRTYPATDRDNPFAQVTLSPLVTPDIDAPPEDRQPFVPTRGGVPFPFTLTTVDRGGQDRSWAAPLVFVQALSREGRTVVVRPELASGLYTPVRQILGRGQTLAVAPPVKAGDTSVEVGHLLFDGVVDAEAVTSRPFLLEARAVVPSMRHLSPQAPAVDLVFAQPYLADGLPVRGVDAPPVPGAPNTGELVLALKPGTAPVVDFTGGSDRSGGFVAPNLTVRGISRVLGAVGEDGTGPSPSVDGRFDPAVFLAGAFPKLFGLFSLLELLEPDGDLAEAPAFVSDSLDALASMLGEAQRLRAALDEAERRLGAEVTGAAHAGARAVAQTAKDALDARLATARTHLDDLVDAVEGLPGTADALSPAAVALAGDLDPLLVAVGVPGVPAAVRSSLDGPVRTLRTLTALASEAEGVAEMLQGLAAGQVTARLSWRPAITPWGLLPGAPGIFLPKDAHPLLVEVVVRASASAPPAVDVLAEISDVDLNLVGTGGTALMKLMFRRIAFHAGSTGKPEVDVVFGGIGFLGPLSFVDRLRGLIPFDGFSDPPYVDVAPTGVTAGFDLALPNVSVGVFSLENIALGADARVPFLGDAMTVGFRFCSKDAPFRLTVMMVGGGGWLGLRAAPKGLVLLELGLEAAASLSVDLGVASGSVSVSVGVYLRLEADAGLLTAYFRIRGEVDVLGLVSASITLELSLTYQFQTGKLVGRASLVVEVEVLFFSASVEITVERKLAGSTGDPTMAQVMPPDDDDGLNADWVAYCDAFAPVPA